MKAFAGLAFVVLLLLSTPLVSGESLGDLARENRDAPRPRAKRVITNDDIPSVNTMRETEAEKNSESQPDSKAKAEPGKSDDAKPGDAKSDDAKPGEKPQAASGDREKKEAERLRQEKELSERVARQQEKVSLMEREMKLDQREHNQATLLHNSDVNAMTNGQAQWAAAENRYTQEMADKQEKLNSERERLEELQEKARRAGVTLPD